jgi:hypothetical protein
MFSIRSFSSLFFIGMLNGLLPCGLVYMAIAGAIGTGNVAMGSAYMILFGLGTIPMLLGITLAGNLMSMAVRKRINKLIPVLVVFVGIFFILRGLSLGIPYLSPPKEKIEKKFEKSLEKEPSATLLEPNFKLPIEHLTHMKTFNTHENTTEFRTGIRINDCNTFNCHG